MTSIDPNNPIGVKGIDYLEFCTDSLNGPTAQLFQTLGFEKTQENAAKTRALFAQGQIRFLLTTAVDQHPKAAQYFQQHGEGVFKIAFKVENAQASLEAALKRGATQGAEYAAQETSQGWIKSAAIQGFGDVLNEFIERPVHAPLQADLTETGPATLKSPNLGPLDTRCSRIDHLTNNVPHGQMEHWVDFYKRIYGFKETRYFDIKGSKTGLFSKVVQSSDHSIIIPINEPEKPNGQSQIQEFLDRHRGPGVQHIALMTPNILSTVAQLRQRGLKFLDVPDTYYDDLPHRPFTVTESIESLKSERILCDGDQEGYLLQVFSDTYIGPLFFEYIQRKNHWGFGEGNFKALFDAIERDQLKRGYIN